MAYPWAAEQKATGDNSCATQPSPTDRSTTEPESGFEANRCQWALLLAAVNLASNECYVITTEPASEGKGRAEAKTRIGQVSALPLPRSGERSGERSHARCSRMRAR